MSLIEKGFHLEPKNCVPEMRKLPEESVDVIVTSPPYNLGVNYGNYSDNLPPAEYLCQSTTWLREAFRILKPEGSLFLNVAGSPSKPLMPYRVLLAATDECGFTLQNTFHWIKSIAIRAGGFWTTYGHYKPINSERYCNDCHEYIFHLTKSGSVQLDRLSIGVPYEDKSCLERFKRQEDKRCRGNNWFIPYPTTTNGNQEPHPASFPAELPTNCLKIHGCCKDSVVLDPFLGIGKSALAAFQCGIETFIGFDANEEYVRLARAALDRARETLFTAEDYQLPQQDPADKTGQKTHPQLPLLAPEDLGNAC